MTKEQKIEFHVQSDDYFGNLATTLDLISQDLIRDGYEKHSERLKKVKEDLIHLQDRYRIIKKN